MINDSNQIVRKDTLKRCLAWFDDEYLFKDAPQWKAITVDFSFNLGSYSGPITSFIRVVDSKLEWMTAINKTTNKVDTVILMKSLKTDWEISKTNGTTIYKKACRPNFESANNDFMIVYSCYYLDGTQWNKESFTEEGFWESSVINSNYIEKEYFSKFTY